MPKTLSFHALKVLKMYSIEKLITYFTFCPYYQNLVYFMLTGHISGALHPANGYSSGQHSSRASGFYLLLVCVHSIWCNVWCANVFD